MTTQHLELIRYQVYAQLKAETARGYLGFLWWVAEPLLFMAVLYAVFAIGLQGGGRDFVPFLLCGLVAWKWFASTVSQSCRAITSQTALMKQVALPKYVFPAALVCANTVKFALSLAILLAVLLAWGVPVRGPWLALPAVLLVQFVLVAAVSGAVAAVVPFLPDLALLVETGLTFLFFVSGIFFDVDALPPHVRGYFALNPIARLVASYRRVLLDGAWPDWSLLGMELSLSLIGAAAVLLVLRRFDHEYPKLGP